MPVGAVSVWAVPPAPTSVAIGSVVDLVARIWSSPRTSREKYARLRRDGPTHQREEVREAEEDGSHDQDRADAELDRVFDVDAGVEGKCAQHEADDPAR